MLNRPKLSDRPSLSTSSRFGFWKPFQSIVY
jgi:hypothetical protein